jgi:hypothetical protein
MSIHQIKKRNRKRLSLENLQRFENFLTVKYIKLMIAEMKHDKKLRNKAIRLAKKRKVADYVT